MKHLVWMYNWLLNKESGITSLDIFTRSKSEYRDLLCCHIWDWPAFVLEPKLLNDQNPPKWNIIYSSGQFIDFSDEKSSLVANVQNLSTRYISSQFHFDFDNLFDMVIIQGENYITIEAICSDIASIVMYQSYWMTRIPQNGILYIV